MNYLTDPQVYILRGKLCDGNWCRLDDDLNTHISLPTYTKYCKFNDLSASEQEQIISNYFAMRGLIGLLRNEMRKLSLTQFNF